MDGYKGFQTFRQIGIAGFEPTTSPSQGERSTKLSHIPDYLTVSCQLSQTGKCEAQPSPAGCLTLEFPLFYILLPDMRWVECCSTPMEETYKSFNWTSPPAATYQLQLRTLNHACNECVFTKY